MLDDKSAQGRADDRGDAKDAGDVALHPRPLDRGIDVADDRRRYRLDGTPPRSLPCSEQGKRDHAPGATAKQGAEQEDAGARKKYPLPPIEIGEPSINWDRYCLSQEI